MPRLAREWTQLDKELMNRVIDAWYSMDDPPSLRALSRTLDVSAPRIMDLRDQKNGRPLIGEYIDLCAAVGLDPAKTLDEALTATGR